jgi:anti-sigma factor (TIGR02949 family)
MAAECGQHRDRFSEYLDGELDGQARAALEAHVAGCAECRQELDALRRTVQAVRDLPAEPAPMGLTEDVLTRLRAEAPGRGAVLVLWSRVLPVAAMLLVVVGLVFSVSRNGLFEGPAEGPRLAMKVPAVHDEMAEVADDYAWREEATAPAAEPRVAGEKPALRLAGAPAEVRVAAPAAEEVAYEREDARGDVLKERRAPVREEKGLYAGARARAPVGGPSAAMDRIADVKAEAAAPAPAPGLGGVVGRDLSEGVGAPTEAAPDSALSWRAMEEADQEAPRVEAHRRVFAGMPGKAVRGLSFTQQIAARPTELPAPVQQMLTIVADDPAELAGLAVQVANANGVSSAVLSLGRNEAGGTVEVQLEVPPLQYDALLRGLVGLTPPERQTLANTRAAEGEFFNTALANYITYQNVLVDEAGRLETDAPAERIAAKAPVRVKSARLPSREAEAVSEVSRADRRAAKAAPPTVNLLIRITRAPRSKAE